MVRFYVGLMVTDADEQAIAKLPESAWAAAVDTDGEIQDRCAVAEITDRNVRTAGWPPGTRLISDAPCPHGGMSANFPTSRRAPDGATRSPRSTSPGCAALSARTTRGSLTRLPSKLWDINLGWVLAANIAADLDAWTRFLGLQSEAGLADAEPDTLRHCLWHLPVRLVSNARHRILKIPADWPWAGAFTNCWRCLPGLADPAETSNQPARTVEPRRPTGRPGMMAHRGQFIKDPLSGHCVRLAQKQ